MTLTFKVNGKPATVDVPPDMPLLWVPASDPHIETNDVCKRGLLMTIDDR